MFLIKRKGKNKQKESEKLERKKAETAKTLLSINNDVPLKEVYFNVWNLVWVRGKGEKGGYNYTLAYEKDGELYACGTKSKLGVLPCDGRVSKFCNYDVIRNEFGSKGCLRVEPLLAGDANLLATQTNADMSMYPAGYWQEVLEGLFSGGEFSGNAFAVMVDGVYSYETGVGIARHSDAFTSKHQFLDKVINAGKDVPYVGFTFSSADYDISVAPKTCISERCAKNIEQQTNGKLSAFWGAVLDAERAERVDEARVRELKEEEREFKKKMEDRVL